MFFCFTKLLRFQVPKRGHWVPLAVSLGRPQCDPQRTSRWSKFQGFRWHHDLIVIDVLQKELHFCVPLCEWRTKKNWIGENDSKSLMNSTCASSMLQSFSCCARLWIQHIALLNSEWCAIRICLMHPYARSNQKLTNLGESNQPEIRKASMLCSAKSRYVCGSLGTTPVYMNIAPLGGP